MEQHLRSIDARLGDQHDTCAGTVRITSVPIVINRLLAPSASILSTRHPGMLVELVPDSRDFNLTRREADLAIRLARPATGGMSVKTRRIGTFEYAPYVAARQTRGKARRLPWITYEDAMAHLPQARWIASITKNDSRSLVGLRVHDAETALEAAAAGVGKTLLPTLVAGRDARLRPLKLDGVPPYPSREVWLLAHSDQIELERITAAIAWIEAAIGASVPRASLP
jgi:DNA-binding transcriptional LysR family regulator